MGKCWEHKIQEDVELKRCFKCKDYLPLTNFNNNRTKWDGKESDCKVCCKKRYSKYWSKKGKERNDKVQKHRRTSDTYKEKARDYDRKRRKTNIQYAIKDRVSRSLRSALEKQNCKKISSTTSYLGCSVQYFKEYLEAQFVEGMSWDNRDQWHIDHRRPCASFDLLDVEQQQMCFHYTNLQPMWALDNLIKNDYYNKDTFTHSWNGNKWVIKGLFSV